MIDGTTVRDAGPRARPGRGPASSKEHPHRQGLRPEYFWFYLAARSTASALVLDRCFDIPLGLDGLTTRSAPLLDGWGGAELAILRRQVCQDWVRFARSRFWPAEQALSDRPRPAVAVPGEMGISTAVSLLRRRSEVRG